MQVPAAVAHGAGRRAGAIRTADVTAAPHGWQRPPLQTAPVAEQVSPAQHASPRAPQVGAGASAVPASTVTVRVVVAVVVLVVVAVGVPVEVLVWVCVLVWVAVAVDDASVAGASRTTGSVTDVSRTTGSVTDVSRTTGSVIGVSRTPASSPAASFVELEPSPAQPASSSAKAQEAIAVPPMWTRPGNGTSVRILLMGFLPGS